MLRSVLTLIVFAVIADGARATAEAQAKKRRLRDTLGLGVKYTQGEPMSALPMLTELGVHWVRDTVSWPEVEPKPGVYARFPAAFVERLAFYRAHDIGVVFMMAYGNQLAYPPTPDAPGNHLQPRAFGGYAAEVTRQLKAAGVRFVLEAWNEPHNSEISKAFGGEWNGKLPSPWVEHYVAMVKEAVNRAKAIDPRVKVLSDDDMWVIHYWFLEAGLPKRLDGFAFHPYTSGGVPEIAAIKHDTDWVRPFVAVDPDGSFVSAVRHLRDSGRAKLGHTPEMWITEWGSPAATTGGTGGANGEARSQIQAEEAVAMYLPRAFLSAQIAGVDVMCWFSSFDGPDGPMGLTALDGRKRPSYFAFKTLSEQLGDYMYERQLLGNTALTTGVQALLFTGDKGRKIAVWTVDQTPRRLKLDGALRGATAVGSRGEALTITPDATGVAWLEVGPWPIYLNGVTRSTLQLELAEQ